jgi:hypothetical protein
VSEQIGRAVKLWTPSLARRIRQGIKSTTISLPTHVTISCRVPASTGDIPVEAAALLDRAKARFPCAGLERYVSIALHTLPYGLLDSHILFLFANPFATAIFWCKV